ncbi:hypothetical protein CKAH01_12874 [Colletotrichum kahawae]|uniref:Uncharacterized protein n=1 Tax=Colletotrichum kahawae TaxID=34407 RepID=A0AAD9YSA5_COLKA|nr:hypothetical protein CKAH01_12874 [Colletotrichum kahawae]
MTWAMLQVHWDGQIAYHQLISAGINHERERAGQHLLAADP